MFNDLLYRDSFCEGILKGIVLACDHEFTPDADCIVVALRKSTPCRLELYLPS